MTVLLSLASLRPRARVIYEAETYSAAVISIAYSSMVGLFRIPYRREITVLLAA
jgi:hypothetical protein